jgi:hypothetical protein
MKTIESRIHALVSHPTNHLGYIEIRDHVHGFRVTVHAIHEGQISSYVEDTLEEALDKALLSFDEDLKRAEVRSAQRTVEWIKEQREEADKRERDLVYELEQLGMTLKSIPEVKKDSFY